MRTVWLVDAGFMMKASPRGKAFDYKKLREQLEATQGTPVSEAYYFDSIRHPVPAKRQNFLNWLKRAMPEGPQMRVKLYDLKTSHHVCDGCGKDCSVFVQKGVDVGVATQMVKLAAVDAFDRLILSAGDGDFEDAVRFVREHCRKEVWLYSFRTDTSADLQSYASRVIWVDDIWDAVQKEPHRDNGIPLQEGAA